MMTSPQFQSFVDKDGYVIKMTEVFLPSFQGDVVEEYSEKSDFFVKSIWHFAENYAEYAFSSDYEKSNFMENLPLLLMYGFFKLDISDIGDSMEIRASVWGPLSLSYVNPMVAEEGDVHFFSYILYYYLNQN